MCEERTQVHGGESRDGTETRSTGTTEQLLRDIVCGSRKKRLATALRVLNEKDRVNTELATVLDREYGDGRARAVLVSSAIGVGVDWLARSVVDRTDTETAGTSVYMLARKYMAEGTDDLERTTRRAIDTDRDRANEDLRMLFLDARETGNMTEIDVLQERFEAVNRENVHVFMNDELVFVLEHLSARIGDVIGGFAADDTCALEYAVRRCHRGILSQVAVDRVEAMVVELVARERDAGLTPAVDYVLGEDGDHGMLKDVVGADTMNMIVLVNNYRKNEVQDFIRSRGHDVEEGVIRWVVGKKKWNALSAMVESVEKRGKREGGVLDDETVRRLLEEGKGDVVRRLAECGYKVKASGREVRVMMVGDARLRNVVKEIGLRMHGADTIDAICRGCEWEVLEEVREKLVDKRELDRYVVEKDRRTRDKYADHVCGRGDIERLASLERKGARASSRGADEASGNGHREMVEYLFEREVMPSAEGVEAASRNGHTEIVRYLFERGMVPRDIDEMIDQASYNGYVDIVRYLVEEEGFEAKVKAAVYASYGGKKEMVEYLYERGVKASVAGANYACANGHKDVVRYLFSKGIRADVRGVDDACTNGHIDMVEYLYMESLKASIVGMNGACGAGHTDIVKYLVLKGVG